MSKIITDLSEVDSQLEAAEYAWLELGDVSKIHTDDILHDCVQKDEIEAAYHFLKVATKPEYLHLFIKEILQINERPITLGLHQCVILQELWSHSFPMFIGSRGIGKTSLAGIYLLLRALLIDGTKVVITGAGFRQAKLTYEYIEQIWNSSPILREICSNDSGSYKESDRWRFRINNSVILALPTGDGQKIRGARANIIFNDEFSSAIPEIYEQVVQGFAAVESDPSEKMKEAAKRQHYIDAGIWSEEQEKLYQSKRGNQSIIAGTCDYDFKHFAKYWRDYKDIILGRKTKTDENEALNPKDYCIIRYPYELIPKGFMDDKTIARAKATNRTIYLMEYGAVFVKDSDGFFKRTLIEQCVCNPSNKIEKKSGLVVFDPKTHGDTSKKHIIAVDPASEKDNLAMVVLELWEDHWRIVRCWTTNRKAHRAKVERKTVSIENYYSYCARKIRDFMREYPTVRIGIDGQGGGGAIIEALHDPSIIDEGEQPIWELIVQGDPKPTDHKEGIHVIERVEFANAEWTSEANHGLRTDLEMKYCLFPRYDALSLTLAADEDLSKDFAEDSMEDAIYEIEELKNELTTIVQTATPSGRDRWDTPEVKTASGRKGRMRKDRYSALVIANMIARSISRSEPAIKYAFVGGLVSELAQRKTWDETKTNHWYQNPIGDFKAIRRGS